MERKKLLIVDDVEINRGMLHAIFEDKFDILEAGDGEEAIEIIKKEKTGLSMIFLDLQMPKKNGIDVLRFMNQEKLTSRIPVIMITAEATVESDVMAYELGASDIIYKPFARPVIVRRAQNLMELFEHRNHLEEKLERRTRQLKESQKKLRSSNEFLVNALSSVVEFRSLESGEHIQRVKVFTNLLLNSLRENFPEYRLTEEQIHLITNASALHDIGKIAIPDEILLKPGRFTPEEFEIMKTHTTKGCELLENFKQEDNEFYRYCYEICRYHHERYDGKGYPDHLEGENIPIWAQVVSIVDVYDALVSKRVYKSAYAMEDAVRMIRDGECGTFSPKILKCFEAVQQVLFDLTEHEFTYSDVNAGEYLKRTEEKKKILVTDDSDYMRDFIRVIVEDAGYEVHTAASGEELLSVYDEIKPDLVLLDIIMEGMSGLETLEELKKKNPDVKTVICSGLVGQEQVVQEAMSKGATACLKKPFGVKDILDTIRDNLAK